MGGGPRGPGALSSFDPSPVRRKQHYLKQLENLIDEAAATGAQLPFMAAFPNLQYSEGPLRLLDVAARTWYYDNLNIRGYLSYVKHILNKHDGEVRLLGDSQWELFPATGGDPDNPGFTVFHPDLWHYQYMTHPETRQWALWRRTSEWATQDLRADDVAWVLGKEGNETTYLKFVPAAGGSPNFQLGAEVYLRRGQFYYKKGHLVTLAEMFRFGCRVCPCFDCEY